jgi:DNA-binding PadR family transcriptional regulator
MEHPRLSAKEAEILRLLIANGEMYGLELVTQSSGKLKRGTVYVTLSRMAEKGYVTSRIEDVVSGPPRRLYSASGQGARVFRSLELASRAAAGLEPLWAI